MHDAPHDLVCLGCSCLCDDIFESRADGASTELPECAIAEEWFGPGNLLAALPECTIAGETASVAAGLAEAARLISEAKSPIVYGLSRTTTPAQRAAVSLADRVGAVLDLEIDAATRPAIIARSRTGWSTATLGEIRSRSDLIVLWCDEPSLAGNFPRLFERYLHADTFVHVGSATDGSGRREDSVQSRMQIRLERSQHGAALSVLLSLSRKKKVSNNEVQAMTGHDVSVWSELLQQMQSANYGTVLFDGSLKSEGNYERLFELVRELNQHTRFVCISPTAAANLTGAIQVLTWSTGYPFGISFASGAPEYSPLEYDAEKMWQRREVDLTLTVVSDPLADASEDAVSGLKHGPLIAIDWRETATTRAANVAFFTSPPGGGEAETAYRFDGVPLPVRGRYEPVRIRDAELLQRLGEFL